MFACLWQLSVTVQSFLCMRRSFSCGFKAQSFEGQKRKKKNLKKYSFAARNHWPIEEAILASLFKQANKILSQTPRNHVRIGNLGNFLSRLRVSEQGDKDSWILGLLRPPGAISNEYWSHFSSKQWQSQIALINSLEFYIVFLRAKWQI